MRPNLTVLLPLLLLVTNVLNSQAPISATLTTNQVKAVVKTDGTLFSNLQKGQFIAPYAPGQPEISLLRTAGLWLTGQDPAGNIKGAVHLYNLGGKTDFLPGTLNSIGEPDSQALTSVYRVTKAEIDAHLADYADNGVIDNPLPAVFGWPGRGNTFFEQYHSGQKLPYLQQGLADFADWNSNGKYDPEAGDAPAVGLCLSPTMPTEMLWFVFHDKVQHTESGMAPIQIEVQCHVFAFDCTEETPLRNTVFVYYKLINRSVERIDDLYISLFNDFSIGNPNDDFFGSDPVRSLVFGYNGDNFDESGFGADIPVMGVKALHGPFDTFGNDLPLRHVMPFDPAQASLPVHYHRLARGHFPDDTPAPNNGLFYPGNPNDPNANSEVSAGNAPGNRRVLASYGPVTMLPGGTNHLLTGYFFEQQNGLSPLQTVQQMYAQADTIQSYLDNCFKNISCSPVVAAPEPARHADLNIYPNPARQDFTIFSEKSDLTHIRLFDLTGREVYQAYSQNPQAQLLVPTAALAPGMYWAKIGIAHQPEQLEKVVVVK